MSLSRVFSGLLALGLLCAVLAGCGSSNSYTDTARSAIDNMASAVKSYNDSPQTSVTSTGNACASALNDLRKNNDLVTEKPPAKYQALAAALKRAYQSAHAGFAQCVGGSAGAGVYTLMVRADAAFQDANKWIARARALDH